MNKIKRSWLVNEAKITYIGQEVFLPLRNNDGSLVDNSYNLQVDFNENNFYNDLLNDNATYKHENRFRVLEKEFEKAMSLKLGKGTADASYCIDGNDDGMSGCSINVERRSGIDTEYVDIYISVSGGVSDGGACGKITYTINRTRSSNGAIKYGYNCYSYMFGNMDPGTGTDINIASSYEQLAVEATLKADGTYTSTMDVSAQDTGNNDSYSNIFQIYQ